MSLGAPTSSTETLANSPPERLSLTRKSLLLPMLCFAQFLDAFNNAALVPAIPVLEASLGITQNQSAWLLSSFQLTFASFLLISGRISDLYNSKIVFVTGLSFLGVISLCAGFANNKIAMLVLRALMGVASATTIPSALTLLVRVFPEPLEQARAIGIFGGWGAGADILGFLIGAILVQYVSYPWIFWLSAIIAIPVSLSCLLIIPSEIATSNDRPDMHNTKWKSLDLIGISILTVALVLFIYAMTSASTSGWATAGVLTALIISVLLIVAFFYWETLVPPGEAAIPPRTWFYNNFSVLFGSALLPFFWWNANFLVFTMLWQDVFHWTVISTAVYILPLSVAAFVTGFTGSLSRFFSPKWIIITGLSMTAVATILLALGGSQQEDYWPYTFPAFVVGSVGVMLTFTHTNIAIFQAAPASMAGTVGAIFNGALQFGSATGLAMFNSIETSLEATHGGLRGHYGRAAAFWFLLGVVLVEILSVSYFYQRATDCTLELKTDGHDTNKAVVSAEEKVLIACHYSSSHRKEVVV